MIEINALRFAYGRHSPVFDNFHLTVNAREKWAVIGPSGCGKSTLLYLLAGLYLPSAGDIKINGMPLERPRPETALVLQDHGLLPWASVFDNARLGLRIRRFYGPDGRHAPCQTDLQGPSENNAAVMNGLKRLGISHLAGQYPAKLSRGQCQRAALARSLVLNPDLLLLDEPFSALDAPGRADLRQLCDQLQAESAMTRIIVTHDIEEAVMMGEYILVLGFDVSQKPRIVSNPCAGGPDTRDSTFDDQCQYLHLLLETLT